MKTKITDKLVASSEWKGNNFIIRDIEIRGFFLSVSKSRKSFKIQVDITKDGRRHSVRRTLGTHAEFSADTAREKALRTIQSIKQPLPDEEPEPCAVSFPEWAEESIRKIHKDSNRSDRNLNLRRAKHYFEPWENMEMVQINTDDALQVLNDIKDREGASSAKICARLMEKLLELDVDISPNIEPARIVDFIGAQRHDFSKENIIPHSQLPQWRVDIENLHSVHRQKMHFFHLYSGLKPSAMVRIHRDWVCSEESIIRFPLGAITDDRSIEFPLSTQLKNFASEACEISTLLHPNGKYLFSNSQNSARPVICREKKMMGRTGHVLRNTYLSIAKDLGIPDDFLQENLNIRSEHKLTGGALSRHDSLRYQNMISQKIDRLLHGANWENCPE
jgi:hypothetical protein